MLRATFRSGRAANAQGRAQPVQTGYFSAQVNSFLQKLSSLSCEHPIRTIALFAIIASTCYINLLESNLFEPPSTTNSGIGQPSFDAFQAGSKTLSANAYTNWKWQNGDGETRQQTETPQVQLALLTLVFPEITSSGVSAHAPAASSVPMLDNDTAILLPSSKNILTPISQEKTLAMAVPYQSTSQFLRSVRELPSPHQEQTHDAYGNTVEGKRWIMSAVRGDAAGQQRTFTRRVADAWTAFVDLLKNAEELDIMIMTLGYLSMWLTFVSLYMSLRRLGSNVWLATTVLFSSSFALLFGLLVTMHFGVPLNVVLLSEGLPFLVVTIGFEKPIILTKAVLSASVALKRPRSASTSGARPGRLESGQSNKQPNIQTAVGIAVQETGYEITRDYAIELLILIIGAASRVQGGLCQFCFLAAWILIFDYILLFTFYTAILTIKLEINRIKRHVAVRRALEEDGVSRRVAEEVASGEDWPRQDTARDTDMDNALSIFGIKARSSSISRFKFLMVAGFIGINLLNFCTIPFRSGARSAGSTLSSAVTQPPMDPFKVAGSGLDSILESAKRHQRSTDVTVVTPIKYELEYPAVHYAVPDPETGWLFDMDFANQFLETVTGGKVVEGVLKSFEDPFLSKWILAALAMSLVLNGYLFNAARWSIKDPSQLSEDGPSRPATRQGGDMDGEPLRPRPLPRSPLGETTTAKSAPVVESTRELERSTSHQRTPEEYDEILRSKRAHLLDDEELVDLSLRGKIPGYALEKTLQDMTRAVKIRRSVVSRTPATEEMTNVLENSKLPYEKYHYDLVHGACCENVIGYMPLPVGVAGPLTIDGRSYFLPMATTEGVLVASISRGCKAINAGGGAITVLTADGMTRGPCIGFQTLARAGQAKIWLDSEEGQTVMKNAFNSTSRFARLQSMKTALAGTYVYIRFKTTTGDAMGMNMISKGVEVALDKMSKEAGFEDMAIISVSGNFCTDKKPAAINWIDGRGKSVVAEAIIPGEVVRSVLKSDVNALVELNTSKNLIGSAMAGSIGGFNAHAANIVAAMFLATGQDPAQTVESANCITVMKNFNGNLQISVSMPCIEVGTIGGGTFLPPQAAMLDLLGVRGAHPTSPGDNSRQLARIIGAATLAGELSLCSALAAGHLVRAHMQHNRSQAPTRSGTPSPGAANGTMTPSAMTMTNLAAQASSRQ